MGNVMGAGDRKREIGAMGSGRRVKGRREGEDGERRRKREKVGEEGFKGRKRQGKRDS